MYLSKKRFCFTVDDNIWFLKELTQQDMKDPFEHPYLALYKRLHERYGLKVQCNLFYECSEFDLSKATDRYSDVWKKNADWLKFSFHSKADTQAPYENSNYDEVFDDCLAVHKEIERFAGRETLAETTTVHYCQCTSDGLSALKQQGVKGLLGLFGTADTPKNSYELSFEDGERIRQGETVERNGMFFAGIDIILNQYTTQEIISKLNGLFDRPFIKVMIHEQYFYPYYSRYQPDFEEKLKQTFEVLKRNGYDSCFFEEVIKNN